MNQLLVLSILSCCAVADSMDIDHDQSIREIVQRFKSEFEKYDDVATSMTDDDNLAVAIEWVKLRDSADGKQLGQRANYFLGFVSGRLRISPPGWWSRAIRKGAPGESLTGFNSKEFQTEWQGKKGDWRYTGINSVGTTSEGLLLKQGDHSLVLKKSDFPDVEGEENRWTVDSGAIAATFQDDLCALAFECPLGGMGGPPRLYCWTTKAKKLVWSRELDSASSRSFGVGGGVNGGLTQVQISGDRVIVWIGHDFSMCFEVFDKSNGKRLARFSSMHLDEIHLVPNQGK
jgi:hypothetical protein